MNIRLEKDLSISRAKFSLLKDMLILMFPEVSNIQKEFLIKLTPDELKRAYMRQAATCHPETIKELDDETQRDRGIHYQRISMAYKALLPHIENIHKKVQEIESRKRNRAASVVSQGKTILAVGGAKGGVGKSVVSTNLAVGLSLLGHRVVVADLDLGGADIHLYLGVKSLSVDWNDFLGNKVSSLSELLTATPFQGVSLIGGNSSKLGSANLAYFKKLKIMRHLKSLDCDYVVIDLGADTSYNVLDFFLMADHKIVVTETGPASVLDTYNFIKLAFYRFLYRFFSNHETLKDLCGHIHDLSLDKTDDPTLESIFKDVRKRDISAYIDLKGQIEQYQLSIVANMADSRRDVDISESLQRLIKKKCFLDVGILGTIPFDPTVRKAARRFTPFIIEDPKCKASQVFHQMLAGILLLREPESIRTEILENVRLVRDVAKDQIGSGTMTLDGQTEEEIRFASDWSPTLRNGLQKFLKLVAN